MEIDTPASKKLVPEEEPIVDEDELSPIEQVRLTVPNTDDPSLAVWTFRMWSLGLLSCCLLSFLNQFFSYRKEPLIITQIIFQVATHPIGRFMASVLPETKFRIPGLGSREFSLNPGPFNMKEHVLICIFANAGSAFGNASAYAVMIVNIIKAFCRRNISFLSGWLLIVTTQVCTSLILNPYTYYEKLHMTPANVPIDRLLRTYVVEPAHMRWPSTLVQISLFRKLHEKEDKDKDSKHQLSRVQFFVIALVCSFCWEIVDRYRASFKGKDDIHTRLMKKYKDIPSWWFYLLLLGTVAASHALCKFLKKEVQLPWWGLIFAAALAFHLHPSCKHSNSHHQSEFLCIQTPGLNIITEYIMGIIFPGRPIANVCFKTYGYMSMAQAISFLSDFKLGHYMKIPPRSMFLVQFLGTILAGTVNIGVAWWLLSTIDDICHNPNSPWTCPNDHVFSDASVIWDLVGPKRIFGSLGDYSALNCFFIFRYRKKWWQRYSYILSATPDAGVAFMAVLIHFSLGMENRSLHWWGSGPGIDTEHSPSNNGRRHGNRLHQHQGQQQGARRERRRFADRGGPANRLQRRRPDSSRLDFPDVVFGLDFVRAPLVPQHFFSYRTEPLVISMISVQVATLPLGRFMARVLPTRKFRVHGLGEFSLNPGPFNMKEHVLISIFANAGSAFGNGAAYAVGIVDIIIAFYRRKISFLASWILVVTTQVLGYGWAGILRKYLVDSPQMWWPSSLVQVSLFRALHENDKNRMSRGKFFLIALICSFSWYVVPGYLFPTLSTISWVCWIFPNSITAQQLGSGMQGLGLGALALDWSVIASYLGSPLISPFFAIANVAVGYFLFMYAILPFVYWGVNLYNAKNFPIFSSHLFNAQGQIYNVSAIVNNQFEIDLDAYRQGRINLSVFFSFTMELVFAGIISTLTHVALFNGR
ncbi:hypothetical protein FEM48_ZijujUnG0106600 [Ziziphus jujuba var. spinosa]|uniref:Oligopeptide transporter 4-like n=1 Tax=Ziziphus jujuba var. spinosa TaxID=714518 RepID=A0A978U849_ZIZJJ|nr:hypothetical protein FEM48_ZijujUnG0106600 [Ziziphus jujuba var. spinosa]